MKKLFARLSDREKIRLRDLFQIALIIETQGKSFYVDVLENVTESETEKLIKWLMQEEYRHRESIHKIIERWRFPAISPEALDRVDQDLKFRGIFRNPPEDKDVLSWLKYALDQEKKMVDFYSSFSAEFATRWKMRKLEKLIDEEMSHVNAIEARIAEFQKNQK